MDRKEDIAKFKKDLADFRFHQKMCWECQALAQEHKGRMGNFNKLCRIHLNFTAKLSGFWPMED
jgi:hypothetical protein